MKYRCIKDTIGFDNGKEYTTENDTTWVFGAKEGHELKIRARDYPEYFEPVKEETKIIWDLKPGDNCYVVEGLTVIHYYYFSGVFDISDALERGELFVTRYEAEFTVNKKKSLASIKKWIHQKGYGFDPDWEDTNQEKHYVMFNHKNGILETSYSYSIDELLLIPYFSKELHVRNMIDEKETELRILFGIC